MSTYDSKLEVIGPVAEIQKLASLISLLWDRQIMKFREMRVVDENK